MFIHVVSFLVLNIIIIIDATTILGKNNNCPLICTCQLEHLTETAIYRFLQKDNNVQIKEENYEYNDVFYDNNLEKEFFEEKFIVRSAICILQTETDPLDLFRNLSQDIELLTIIQGYDTGNKTIKFSHFNNFTQLISIELLGPNSLNELTNSHLFCEIDTSLPNLKYLNLENILIKTSVKQIQNLAKEISEEALNFEYAKKFDSANHPLTIIQKGTNEEILPYDKYKEQDNTNKIPLFIGFKNLFLLRITKCELNSVHWTMFDGLQNLQYLILEKNNLRFIPPFAFYGTPNLKTLSLARNNLLDIQITDLAGLLELEYLDLSFNNFSQLSELSLPPFPKLKLASFANNPITVIFPNTFEVMNTTDSLIIGSDDVDLSLMTNSFLGLNLLQALTIINLNINLLKRDFFIGMSNLKELILSGNITSLEFDTFLEIYQINKLTLASCNIKIISMDAFVGLENLHYLDLSKNQLEYLPPGTFDQLINIKELYLNNNKFKQLPRDIFSKIHPKLIRLNENPWHCSCEMSDWKPMIVNKLKQKIIKPCEITHDKMSGCSNENRFAFKYIYENKVAPKCATPNKYVNWSVFHAMRRLLKCPEYKPKFKKLPKKVPQINLKNLPTITNQTKLDVLNKKLAKHDFVVNELNSNLLPPIKKQIDLNNNLNILDPMGENTQNTQTILNKPHKYMKSNHKIKKYRKRIVKLNKGQLNIKNSI